MKLYIPEISDEIRLTADWNFGLYNEDRNQSLMELMKDTRKVVWGGSPDYGHIPCTIPAGSILKVDRVYIRKGKGEFSSLTFLWKGAYIPSKMEPWERWNRDTGRVEPTGEFQKIPRRPIRFWAKLEDVNNIEFEMV